MFRQLFCKKIHYFYRTENVAFKRTYVYKPESKAYPRLMDFPEIIWPSTFKSIKNWFIINFIIKPYLDKDFQTKYFILGAKQALQVISSRLSNGEFCELRNYLSSDALEELKSKLEKLSVAERKQLEIVKDDVYFTFPYQIGLIFDDPENKTSKRYVEVTMVFHVLQGLKELKESGQYIPWSIGSLPEYQDKIHICNYRFIKEFTKGCESDWTVNVVNHFKPIDLIKNN